MKPLHALRLALVFFSALHSAAQVCSPSPVEAARSAVGEVPSIPAVKGAKADGSYVGFRVIDVQADPVMHRVWFRVARCDRPDDPPRFVPLRAILAGDQLPQRTLVALSATAPESLRTSQGAVPRTIDIRAGEPVSVILQTDAMHMELSGSADSPASIGDTLSVTLPQRANEPPHRIRGILRAEHRVEVQP